MPSLLDLVFSYCHGSFSHAMTVGAIANHYCHGTFCGMQDVKALSISAIKAGVFLAVFWAQ